MTFRYSRLLCLVILIGLVASLMINVRRHEVEQRNMTVDFAIDYLRELSGTLTFPPTDEEFFGALPDFRFASGVGGWSTSLVFSPDGSAELSFHDSDMGDTGDGYPNGTVYVCDCRYVFGELKRENAYVWSARILERDPDGPEVGEEWIEDGVRYVQSVPYGLENADRVYFYLPGAPTAELTSDFLLWLSMPRAWGGEYPLTLPCWGLYSPNDETGFSGGEA